MTGDRRASSKLLRNQILAFLLEINPYFLNHDDFFFRSWNRIFWIFFSLSWWTLQSSLIFSMGITSAFTFHILSLSPWSFSIFWCFYHLGLLHPSLWLLSPLCPALLCLVCFPLPSCLYLEVSQDLILTTFWRVSHLDLGTSSLLLAPIFLHTISATVLLHSMNVLPARISPCWCVMDCLRGVFVELVPELLPAVTDPVLYWSCTQSPVLPWFLPLCFYFFF